MVYFVSFALASCKIFCGIFINIADVINQKLAARHAEFLKDFLKDYFETNLRDIYFRFCISSILSHFFRNVIKKIIFKEILGEMHVELLIYI